MHSDKFRDSWNLRIVSRVRLLFLDVAFKSKHLFVTTLKLINFVLKIRITISFFPFFFDLLTTASLQNFSRLLFCQNNNFKKKTKTTNSCDMFFQQQKKTTNFLTKWKHLFSLRFFLFFFLYFFSYKNFGRGVPTWTTFFRFRSMINVFFWRRHTGGLNRSPASTVVEALLFWI